MDMLQRKPLGFALSDMLGQDQTTPMPSGKPTKGQLIAGILADALAGATGHAGTFGPMWAQQRQRGQELEQQQIQWQRNRQANNDDWLAHQQYQDAHRTPTAFEDNAGNRWVTDPVTGENRMVFVDRAPKQFIQDGQLVTVPNPFAQGASPAPQTITEEMWNSGQPVGGPTPQASGGFPRR